MIEKYINTIRQGDCLALFKDLPENSVDISFADPPFNLGKKYSSYKDSVKFEKYLHWCEMWIAEMVRVTKPTGSIFVHNIPRWLTYYSRLLNKTADFKHWISWDAPTAPMGKSLQPAHYGVLYYAKDAKRNKYYEIRYPHKRCRKCGYLLKDYGGKKEGLHPFGPLVSDVWTDIHRIKHNKYRDKHPCQLPIHLLGRIILMSTDEGDIVLDPFVGTGTTAIASKRLGRNYICFDIDEAYVEITKEKLTQEEEKSRLGNIWVSYFLNEIITIRDKDWTELSSFYELPYSNKKIDYIKIDFKNRKEIHNHFKCFNKRNERKSVEEELLFHI